MVIGKPELFKLSNYLYSPLLWNERELSIKIELREVMKTLRTFVQSILPLFQRHATFKSFRHGKEIKFRGSANYR